MALITSQFLHSTLVILVYSATKSAHSFLVRDYDVYPISYFVRRFGYPLEIHANVSTEDGYLLNLYRIPYGKVNNSAHGSNREPVLLVHGLSSSCEDFVVTGPKRGLAFILANAGYDVWLGNVRGNLHSRKHMWLNPDRDDRFWEFSFHESGYYDLPAFIRYIQNITLQKQIMYVGHSQGGTVFFVMASTRPEFKRHIKLMVGLAPAVYMENMRHPLLRPLAFSVYGDILAGVFDKKEFVHITPELEALGRVTCGLDKRIANLCADVIFLTGGNNSMQFNKSLIQDLLRYEPAGASARQIVHFMQEIRSGQFRRFDLGPRQNKRIYGSPSPPTYDLKKVSTPVAIYYAKNDFFVEAKDIRRLKTELPNVVRFHEVNYTLFTHLDFIYANDVVSLLYKDVMETMESYR